MPLLVLSGCDGSGKTTLAKLLSTYLSRYGPARVFLVSGEPPLSLSTPPHPLLL